MSNLKRASIIFIVVIGMIIIGYLRLMIGATPFEESSEYFTWYMIGYSAPILSTGLFVWLAFFLVFREKKSRVKRTVRLNPMATHQIPAFGNS